MTFWYLTAAILLIYIFVPRIGLLAIFIKWQASRRREQVEDSLKHLLDREQGGRHASPESLAGSLGMSRVKTTSLIASMESQGLIESRNSEIHLTPEGERWAMHIVRAHRLWERYLADEARMPLEMIHNEANRREHGQTAEQLDQMEAALGHPTTDPHGDPIPTRDGIMHKADSTPITGWQENQNEYRLAPAVAANIFVAPLPEGSMIPAGAISLDELKQDQHAEILNLDEAVQGFTRRRFLDLGLTPGTEIYPELQNFFRDPRGYRVRGTLIALRKDQAAKIWVQPVV